MNSSKASPLGANIENFGKVVDVRIILSSLWIARMLSSLQGDSARLHDPQALQELVSGTSEIPITDTLVLVMSIVMAIPILMSFLSLILKDKANRRANLSAGVFFVAWEIFFLVSVYSQDAVYEIFWGFAYLLFAVLVVGYAWKWPKKEA